MVRQNMILRELFREVGKNKGRFLSIFFIVLLGSAFFTGIRSTRYNMNRSAEQYYDETHLMDFRVISTLGLTEEDLTDLRAVEGVFSVTGNRTAEVITTVNDHEYAVRLIGITSGVNELKLTDGRLPESDDECVLDAYYARQLGLSVGDTLTVTGDKGADLSGTLSRTEFSICGLGSCPYYLDLTRGTGSVGSGTIDLFAAVKPQVFLSDVYTEAYVLMNGAEELNAEGKAYQKLADATETRLKALGDVAIWRRYNALHDQLTQAEADLAQGKADLEEAGKQISDGEQQIADAEQLLSEKETELAEGREALAAGEAELASAQAQYATGLSQYQAGLAAYQEGLAQYYTGMAQYRQGLAEYQTQYAAYQEALPAYEEGLAAYNAGQAQYQSGLAVYQTLQAANETAKTALAGLTPQIAALEARIAEAPEESREVLNTALETLRQAASSYEQQIATQSEQLATTQQELEDAKAQLDAFEPVRAQMESARSQLDAAKVTLDLTLSQLTAGKLELDTTKDRLDASKSQLDDAAAQIATGLSEVEANRKLIEDGEQALADGYEELEKNREELEKAKEQYEEALEDSKTAFPEAEQKIADGWEQLNALEIPEWYILGRSMIASYVSHESDADRMWNLGKVFPVIFFLVAALVSLTAMTRMVEEQRVPIGTLKALGYSDRVITWRYLGYALAAALPGAVIGAFAGALALPWVIQSAYGILYVSLPYIGTRMDPVQGILSIVTSVGCILVATLIACYRQMKSGPAELMRPEAPKKGKRVFLERIGFLWKLLNFNLKTMVRNLFRYKKRLFMTLFGIGGCMALLLVGFGLHDSITEVAKRQYVEIFRNTARVALDTAVSEEKREALEKYIETSEAVTDSQPLYMQNVELMSDRHSRTAYLYVPENVETAARFLQMQDRISRRSIDYPAEGAVLSEKTAKMLGVRAGDTIIIRNGRFKPAEVTVTDVMENYVLHYCFISKETYRQLFGEDPEWNQIDLIQADTSEEAEDALGKDLMGHDAVLGVSFTRALEGQIDDMLGTLNIVIVVLIVSAGALAFVVLYNLNSINLTERRRELATLKVLGFYDLEAAMSLYRENLVLTVLGIGLGVFLGIALHQFTIQTVEVDLMMFGRVISLKSFLISSGITFAFAVAVNAMMYWNMKKIDMVESLKSVE